MSENLIYGADITAYGADRSGETDSTDAFLKAIENGESLISVPYGSYKITRNIVLRSNTKLHLHKNAALLLEDCTISARDCANIIISGGKIYGKVCFNEVNGIKLHDTLFFDVISFGDCQNVKVSKVSISEKAHFELLGECEGLTFKSIVLSNSGYFLKLEKSTAKTIKCDNIQGSFTDSFIDVCDGSVLEDADFEGVKVHHATGNNGAYFKLCGHISGMEIEGFAREAEYESLPLIPTIILSPRCDTAMILDGTSLDNVICARGASKTVSMTTAKLQNPTGKFIYTFECGIKDGDTFTMPLGDFDFVSIYEK